MQKKKLKPEKSSLKKKKKKIRKKSLKLKKKLKLHILSIILLKKRAKKPQLQ